MSDSEKVNENFNNEQQAEKPAASFFNLKSLFSKNPGDLIFENITRLFAFIVFLLVFIMAYEMVKASMPSIKQFGLKFITGIKWDPVDDIYGALPYIWGTLFSSLLALIVSIPLSLSVAIFLSEFAPKWLEKTVSVLVEMLAAIPSIV